jgi:uncharacterized protein with GYD domain
MLRQPDGIRGLLKDSASGRRDAVSKALKSVGGKLEAFYYAFGDNDVICIMDLPDNVTAAGLAAQVSASGMVRVRTTPLLSVDEADKAIKLKPKYRVPGE